MFRLIPKLLIGSVFVPHEKAALWYKLQIKYLKKTVKFFKHVVCINGEMDQSLFTESDVIKACNYHSCNSKIGIDQSRNHCQGLLALLSYFRNHKYEDYLILDSDCFPILKNWHYVLKKKMKENFKYAAPYRTENLDFFPHPCAFFIRGDHINSPTLDFSLSKEFNMKGVLIEDVGCKIPKKDCYPLIRSNFFNAHPIFAAVYNHMFYHHGCGSRVLLPRSILCDYFDHYLNRDFHELQIDNLIKKLEQDPDAFIESLTRKPC